MPTSLKKAPAAILVLTGKQYWLRQKSRITSDPINCVKKLIVNHGKRLVTTTIARDFKVFDGGKELHLLLSYFPEFEPIEVEAVKSGHYIPSTIYQWGFDNTNTAPEMCDRIQRFVVDQLDNSNLNDVIATDGAKYNIEVSVKLVPTKRR